MPVYAKALTAQMSSLAAYSPAVEVSLTICTAHSDSLTIDTANAVARNCYREDGQISVSLLVLDEASLFRRAIGRNIAAKGTTADLVWFCDADYWFGPGCLDALAEIEPGNDLVYPRSVMCHRSLALGDADLAKIEPGVPCDFTQENYAPRSLSYAIGGAQIVSGDTARRIGYCDGTRWVKSLRKPVGFKNTSEDVSYRKQFSKCRKIDLPNVFRIRHTESALQPPEQRR